METQRQQKVSRLLQKELGAILLADARNYLPGSMVSVTVVRISPDLSVAKVYLSIFPIKDKAKAIATMREHAWEVRKKLGARIRHQLRIVPEIVFYIDDSYDYAARIEDLLKK